MTGERKVSQTRSRRTRLIRPQIHALLDAVSSALLLTAPVPARFRPAVRLAGVGVAAYSVLTRYDVDSKRPISMTSHLALDAAQGAAFVAAALLSDAPRPARLGAVAYGIFSISAAMLTDRRPALSTRQIPMARSNEVSRARATPAEVAADVSYLRLGLVNVIFLGARNAPDREWMLVDAGLPGTALFIEAAANRRFGRGSRPAAILLTHGHFDHVGALRVLAERWDCPIFAHPAEYPHLAGIRPYPPAKTEVGGGLLGASSRLFPRSPVDITDRLRRYPVNGAVPGAPGWRWIHTPGHTQGHVSFWREQDRLLLSGDAVITTRQESLRAVIFQKPELHGPPAYFTENWREARESVRTLAQLRPLTLLSSHGRPLTGVQLQEALERLPRIEWVHG